MFTHNPNINPVVSEINKPKSKLVYFALKSGEGWCAPGIYPWSESLHIVIDPVKSEYNDEIVCEEMIVKQRLLGFVELPDNYLANLVRLSKDELFLDIRSNQINRSDVCDGGSQTIEYYIGRRHKRLWCYFMDVIDGGDLLLKPTKGEENPVSFITGIEGTSELIGPTVALYYRKRKEDYRARDFVAQQQWRLAKTILQIQHYYCLKGMSTDMKEFEWFVQYILDNSVPGEFNGDIYNYCYLDEWKYWIMEDDPSKCILINREVQTDNRIE